MISSYFLVTTLHHHRQAECGDAQRAAVSFSRRVPVAVVRAGVAVGSESQAMKYGEWWITIDGIIVIGWWI